MLEISKILTVFVDGYTDFEVVGEATGIDTDNKNKIGIGGDLEVLTKLQGLLINLGYDLDEIKAAFQCKTLDYINFEYWN
jgi:hypothetical protein